MENADPPPVDHTTERGEDDLGARSGDMDNKPIAEPAAAEQRELGDKSSESTAKSNGGRKVEDAPDTVESVPDTVESVEGVEGLDGLEGEVSMEGLDDDDGANEVVMSDPVDGSPHEGKRVKVSPHIPFCCCLCLTRAFFPLSLSLVI